MRAKELLFQIGDLLNNNKRSIPNNFIIPPVTNPEKIITNNVK